jgi:replication factor C small subunit
VTGDEIKDMLKTVIEKENLEVDSEALDAIIYVSDGDMRRAINVLQGAAMQTDKITEKTIYAISSRARPTEVQDILKFAMGGEFNKARKNLDKLMVEYGMDGEDILLQMYYETINMDIGDKTKVKIVDKIGEYNFRMVEGANERIQLEALLAQLMNLE